MVSLTITNPLGVQLIDDGENPRIFTALTQTILSGGALVQVTSGTLGLTGSSASTFGDGDIIVQQAEDLWAFNGVITQNTGSNEYAGVLTRGRILMRAGGPVSGGTWVTHNASGCVQTWYSSESGTAVIQQAVVGRAMQTIGSGTDSYGIIDLLG